MPVLLPERCRAPIRLIFCSVFLGGGGGREELWSSWLQRGAAGCTQGLMVAVNNYGARGRDLRPPEIHIS